MEMLWIFIRTDEQNLFPIVQGGLDKGKRRECAQELIKRDTPGFAIGGLSGGEAKDDFWRMVSSLKNYLPCSLNGFKKILRVFRK